MVLLKVILLKANMFILQQYNLIIFSKTNVLIFGKFSKNMHLYDNVI